MRGAKLEGADLTGTNLEGTKLQNATYDDETVFPLLFQPELHGMKYTQKAEDNSSFVIVYERRDGHYNDYHSRVMVRDGHVWVRHRVFDVFGDRPGTPVHFDRKMTSPEIANLKQLAAQTKLPNKPCPEIKITKSDRNPGEIRVAIMRGGVRREVRFRFQSEPLTKKTKPLASAMKELRDKILKENNWVDEGL
jgi:hypothetical protein